MYEENYPMIKVCPICGKEKTFYNMQQRFCRECAKERTRAQQRSYIKTWKLRDQGREKEIKPSVDIIKNNMSIEDVLVIADKHGISYGKAVLLQSKGGK